MLPGVHSPVQKQRQRVGGPSTLDARMRLCSLCDHGKCGTIAWVCEERFQETKMRICVYCSSSNQVYDDDAEAAEDLGRGPSVPAKWW